MTRGCAGRDPMSEQKEMTRPNLRPRLVCHGPDCSRARHPQALGSTLEAAVGLVMKGASVLRA
jgi:hypothetical protein